MRARVGVDVGGTFTDVVLYSGSSEKAYSTKTPTNASDQSQSVLEGIRTVLRNGRVSSHDLGEVVVGSTVILNSILAAEGSTTALMVTEGFRDVLAIGRERRALLYDVFEVGPPMLVPRHRVIEVPERIGADGTVIRSLDRQSAERLVKHARTMQVESLAICLLHAYANYDHERVLIEAVERVAPEMHVSASHQIWRHAREYERSIMTVLNAFVSGPLNRYLDAVEQGLGELAPSARLLITDSAGSAMAPHVVRQRPLYCGLSGPAAGVAGASFVSSIVDRDRMLTMDMGGTSCDVALVEAGEPALVNGGVLGPYEVNLTTVDVTAISAGGGTVAWVDDGGVLRVGPKSMGARPGPACYGAGGTEATITDAQLVLGRIHSDTSLDGTSTLDHGAAGHAIDENVAGPLGMSVIDAALGIIKVAEAAMIRAMEVVSVERGNDPREFSLCAYGGAGPLHAASIADELGIDEVFIPRDAGVLSALGALGCDERYEVSQTVLLPTENDAAALAEVRRATERLLEEAVGLAGCSPNDIASGRGTVILSADVRYVGQTSCMRLPIDQLASDTLLSDLHLRFEESHESRFGYHIEGAASEVESLTATTVISRDVPHMPKRQALGSAQPQTAEESTCYLDASGPRRISIYSAAELRPNDVLDGPAIVSMPNCSVVVPENRCFRSDEFGNLFLTRQTA